MRLKLHQRSRAFTLVEIILAIVIIAGIITVLLYFYQRSVEVRQIVLQETEFLSVSRMLLEQVTGELRTARTVEDQFIGFEGGSNQISFVCTTVPQTARWIASSNDAVSLAPTSDLKKVTYRLLVGTNTASVRGVDRTEELLTGAAFTAGTNSTEFVSTNSTSELEVSLVATNEVDLIRRPLTAIIKRLDFRFWDGTNWVGTWSGLSLPAGVEISIGREPFENTPEQTSPSGPAAPDPYSPEIFRRVVYLPNSIPRANKIVGDSPVDTFF